MSHGDDAAREKSVKFLSGTGASERRFGVRLQIRADRDLVVRGTDGACEGDEDYTISTVPAFTDAASAAPTPETEKSDSDVADLKMASRPLGPRAFKPG